MKRVHKMNYNGTVIDRFEYSVEVTEHTWVPMSDDIRLSVKLWKPVPRTEGEVFPAIIEAIPYRKDDVSLWDDSVRMAYVAGSGYVCARLDLRGSGDSEGFLDDEYSTREQCDICEAIAWLSNLPECDGNVGMTGISWSGFNSLQVAARRPPALKAIITVCSTDDRYDNDVHYMGGSILGFYQNWWGSIMHEFNLRPADPRIVGDEWRSLQALRMNCNPQLTSIWLAHQTRDDYWRPGSVCEDYSRIECPVLAVSGWADGYTDSVVRLVDNCTAPVKGLIGPWGHTWPERGIPGPTIGFLQECVRWWDRWLKGIHNGADANPQMCYYLQEPCALTPDCTKREGVWMQTEHFSDQRPANLFKLDADGMLLDAAMTGSAQNLVSHKSSLLTGTQVDTWLPMGSPIDLPSEQTPDDERSLCFDTAVLEQDIEVVGQPVVELCVAVDSPEAFVFARLCDVWPDGTSQLITRGNMNLTHWKSHEFPEDLTPGRFYDVSIPLKVVAQRIPAGHKLRLSLSTNYWPWIWPNRTCATITLDAPQCTLRVPASSPFDRPLIRPFEPSQIARGESCEALDHCEPYAIRTYDPETGVLTYRRSTTDCVTQRTPSGFTVACEKMTTYRINENDPLSAVTETLRDGVYSRGDWKIGTHVFSTMSCTHDDFIVTTETEVSENGKPIHSESHTETIARHFN